MDYEEPLFFRVIQYAAHADRDVIDMVSGSPDWEPPEALREGLRQYADADPSEFSYPASRGLRELREEIAARRDVDADRVVITNGTCEANYLAMAEALERGRTDSDAAGGEGAGTDSDAAGGESAVSDEVLLTDPVYPYYPGRVQLLGGRYSFVPVERDGTLDPETVRAQASEETAAIVVNTPNNPTGAVYPYETMEELVEIAEEYDAYLVADEVYDHFDYTGEFESALTIDSDRRIVTSGFSKSMAITGWRVGYAIFPEDMVDAAATRHMLVNISASRPAMAAVTHALRNTGPDYYAGVRDLLEERIGAFTDALDVAGADYTEPDGAFYVMARFDNYPGTMANVERLIDEAGVAGMPGEAFGEAYDDWIRFALVTPRVQEAADRLAEFFGE